MVGVTFLHSVLYHAAPPVSTPVLIFVQIAHSVKVPLCKVTGRTRVALCVSAWYNVAERRFITPRRKEVRALDIDFEKIRQEAREKVFASLPDNPAKPVMKGQVNLMSRVAMEMLIAYHQAVSAQSSQSNSRTAD